MATGQVISSANELAHRRVTPSHANATTWIQNPRQRHWPIITAGNQTVIPTHEGVWRRTGNTWAKALTVSSPIPGNMPGVAHADQPAGNGSFMFPPRLWPAQQHSGTWGGYNPTQWMESLPTGIWAAAPRGLMITEIQTTTTNTVRIVRVHYVAANTTTTDPPAPPDFNFVTVTETQFATTDPRGERLVGTADTAHTLRADWEIRRRRDGDTRIRPDPYPSPIAPGYLWTPEGAFRLAEPIYAVENWKTFPEPVIVGERALPTENRSVMWLFSPTGHFCPPAVDDGTTAAVGIDPETVAESRALYYLVQIHTGATPGETRWRNGAGSAFDATTNAAIATSIWSEQTSDWRTHEFADIDPTAGFGCVWQRGAAVGMVAVLRTPTSGNHTVELVQLNGWQSITPYASVALPPGTSADQFDRILIAADESQPWGEFLVAVVDFRYSQGDGTAGSSTVGSGSPIVWANRYNRNDNAWKGWAEFTDTSWDLTDYPSPIMCWQEYMPDGIGRLVFGRHQGANPGQTLYYELAANEPPFQPTVSPVVSPLEITVPLVLDWEFQDRNINDTQSQFQIERVMGTTIEYRRTNGQWTTNSAAADTIHQTADTRLDLLTGWGADTDPEHAYRVRVWDNHLAGPSPWSNAITVIPTVRINPTITHPAANATVAEMVNVQWTAATQAAYRIRVYADTTFTIPTHDTGQVFDGATRSHTIPMDTTQTDRWIRFDFWNADFYPGQSVTVPVRVVFTPPNPPTVSLATDNDRRAVVVTITPGTGNPSAPAAERFDLFRRPSALNESAGIRVAQLDGNQTHIWHDYTVADEVDYAYRATVFSPLGGQNQSAWTT